MGYSWYFLLFLMLLVILGIPGIICYSWFLCIFCDSWYYCFSWYSLHYYPFLFDVAFTADVIPTVFAEPPEGTRVAAA